MTRRLCAAAIALVIVSCASPSATPSATPSPIVASSPSSSPRATAVLATASPLATSTATNWAVACGTVSSYVRTQPNTDGSFVLSSPGRTALKITVPVARVDPTEGGFSGYVCAGLLAGVPAPIEAGLAPPNTAGFIPEGTYPATKAMPSPAGFIVPQACAYIRPPEVGADQTNWWVDCGAELNRNARGTLGAALTQQGWTGCGPATATETFFKGTMRMVVVESSLAPGDYPRFSQIARPAGGCG